MTEFQSTEKLREFILNRQEGDEDILGVPGHCWGLVWKKDRWVVKSNNKKVTVITTEDVPEGFNMRDREFPCRILSELRTKSIDRLSSYLREINNVS